MIEELLREGAARARKIIREPFYSVVFEAEAGKDRNFSVTGIFERNILLSFYAEALEQKAKKPMNPDEVLNVAKYVGPLNEMELEVDQGFTYTAYAIGIGFIKKLGELESPDAVQAYQQLKNSQRLWGRWKWSRDISPLDVACAWYVVDSMGQEPYLSFNNEFGEIAMAGYRQNGDYRKYFSFLTDIIPHTTLRGIEWFEEAFSEQFPFESLTMVEAAYPDLDYSRQLTIDQRDMAIAALTTSQEEIPLITLKAMQDF